MADAVKDGAGREADMIVEAARKCIEREHEACTRYVTQTDEAARSMRLELQGLKAEAAEAREVFRQIAWKRALREAKGYEPGTMFCLCAEDRNGRSGAWHPAHAIPAACPVCRISPVALPA